MAPGGERGDELPPEPSIQEAESPRLVDEEGQRALLRSNVQRTYGDLERENGRRQAFTQRAQETGGSGFDLPSIESQHAPAEGLEAASERIEQRGFPDATQAVQEQHRAVLLTKSLLESAQFGVASDERSGPSTTHSVGDGARRALAHGFFIRFSSRLHAGQTADCHNSDVRRTPHMTFRQSEYQKILDASRRVTWRLDDVLGDEEHLDPSRPFLPEELALVAGLPGLDDRERLALNHVRSSTYLSLFGSVERFILPFVVDHARSRLGKEPCETQALLGFAQEESKHLRLFERFAERFALDVGVTCPVIGPPEALAENVLSHDPLGVALAVLHIEWMTQRHYTESVKDDGGLDPLFVRLLRSHWLEESQHARLDTLIVLELTESLSPADVRRGAS